MDTFLLNAVLYGLGVAALLTSYLAFSPATRDLVVFLSRTDQIVIFRYRRVFWAVGLACLGLLAVRCVVGLFGLESAAAVLGMAGTGWLVLVVLTAAGLGLAFWATYVPVVMAPPEVHELIGAEAADAILKPESIVLGLVMGDTVRAYPRDLIARPHWFNDHLDGKPFMISYCILCNSGQAFHAKLANGTPLNLRNMTAFDNNTVYHDTETGNFIQQLDGRVIDGPDAGEVLEAYPVVMASWGEWKKLHPETTVFYAPPMTLRDRTVQKMLQTMIPIEKLAARDEPWHLVRGDVDARLPAMSFVFGVEVEGEACAYPVSGLKENPVINDTVGGAPVVVLYDKEHDIGQIFLSTLDGRRLTFNPASDPGVVARDVETGSSWDVSGRATAGELTGQSLSTLPHWNQLFWFSWAAFKKGTRINQGQSDGQPAS